MLSVVFFSSCLGVFGVSRTIKSDRICIYSTISMLMRCVATLSINSLWYLHTHNIRIVLLDICKAWLSDFFLISLYECSVSTSSLSFCIDLCFKRRLGPFVQGRREGNRLEIPSQWILLKPGLLLYICIWM